MSSFNSYNNPNRQQLSIVKYLFSTYYIQVLYVY